MKKIRVYDLRSTRRLLRLRSALAPELDGELFVALAQRALQDGRNPTALFRWLLRHPESWDWLSEKDLAEARKSLLRHPRRRVPRTARRTYSDCSVKRFCGVSIDRKRFTSAGWEAEAEAKGAALDKRLLRRETREKADMVVRALVLLATILWFLW